MRAVPVAPTGPPAPHARIGDVQCARRARVASDSLGGVAGVTELRGAANRVALGRYVYNIRIPVIGMAVGS